MKEIKFTSKENIYQTADGAMYENPYIIPFADTYNTETKVTSIRFKMCYVDADGQEQRIKPEIPLQIVFPTENIDTIVNIGTEEEPIEEEITKAISEGWTYNLQKVLIWGHPDFQRATGYYQRLNGVFQLPDNPVFAQLVIDFIKQAVMIENQQIGENFEYQEPITEEI